MNERVPYIAHESIVAKMERTIKRLYILIIISVFLIFASNAVWLYYWNQYEYTDEKVRCEQDGEGTNVIGSGNEVTNEPEVNH